MCDLFDAFPCQFGVVSLVFIPRDKFLSCVFLYLTPVIFFFRYPKIKWPETFKPRIPAVNERETEFNLNGVTQAFGLYSSTSFSISCLFLLLSVSCERFLSSYFTSCSTLSEEDNHRKRDNQESGMKQFSRQMIIILINKRKSSDTFFLTTASGYSSCQKKKNLSQGKKEKG